MPIKSKNKIKLHLQGWQNSASLKKVLLVKDPHTL